MDAAATCPAGSCQADPAKLSLTGVQAGQAIVAIIAVLAVSNEYSTGMIRITLTAMPRRLAVLAAKATLVAGLVLAVSAVAVLASVLAGRLILPGHGFTPAHGYPPLSPGPRARPAGRLRLGPLPGPDRAAQPRRRDRRAGDGGGDRARPRPAVRVPGRDQRDRQPALAAAPGADRPDDRRASTSRPRSTCAACRSPPGRASACSPCGPPGRSSSAPWSCASATPDRPVSRRPGPATVDAAAIPAIGLFQFSSR